VNEPTQTARDNAALVPDSIDPTNWLRHVLLGGARDSRYVLEVGTRVGLTPKQLRRARENLGVVVTRSGCREAMRSSWELPSEVSIAALSASGTDGDAGLATRESRVRARDDTPDEGFQRVRFHAGFQSWLPDCLRKVASRKRARRQPSSTAFRIRAHRGIHGSERRCDSHVG
jgi:hypothetical protein